MRIPRLSLHFNDGQLAGQAMQNIGKVNVLCGPNSSGKTYTLSHIAERRYDTLITINDFVDYTFEEFSEVRLLSETDSPEKAKTAIASIFALDDWNDTFNLYAPEAGFKNIVIPDASLALAHSLEDAATRCREILKHNDVLQPHRSIDTAYEVTKETRQVDSMGRHFLEQLYRAKNSLSLHDLQDDVAWVREKFAHCTSGVNVLYEMTENNRYDLVFQFYDGECRFAKECGLGLRVCLQLLVIARMSQSPNIYIEEPETSLHPELLYRLFEVLVNDSEKIIFATTHSNVLLRSDIASRVFTSRFHAGEIVLSDQTSKTDTLTMLGYSITDNLTTDVVVFVEGTHDVSAVRYLIDEYVNGRTLYKRYYLWPVGGNSMGNLCIDAIAEGKQVFAILDGEMDNAAVSARRKFSKECTKHGGKVFQLERYAIDNYWSVGAYKGLFQKYIPDNWEVPHDKPLANTLPSNFKKHSRDLAKLTGMIQLKATDLGCAIEEIASFLTSSS